MAAIFCLLLLPARARAQHPFWFTAYYPTWAMNSLGTQFGLPPWDINWNGITHVVHFFGRENIDTTKAPYWSPLTVPNDSIDYLFNGFSNPGCGAACWISWADSLISIAHAHGAKVLVDIHAVNPTGWNVVTGDSTKTDRLASSVIGWCRRHGYDGVELDVETWTGTQVMAADLNRGVRLFRKYLNTMTPRGILTIAASPFHSNLYYAFQDSMVDHFDIQYYAFGNIWNPAIAHNSVSYLTPLYPPPLSGACAGSTQMSTQGTLSSTISGPRAWVLAGHDPKKIGVGLATFGYTYRGVDQLCGSTISDGNVAYTSQMQINSLLGNGGAEYWDVTAMVPYIRGTARSLLGTPTVWGKFGVLPGQPFFATFENQRSIREKVNWVKAQGYGGIMLYDLTMDLDPSRPVGHTNPLHLAAGDALNGVTSSILDGAIMVSPDSLPPGGGKVVLSWTSSNALRASISPEPGTVPLMGSDTIGVTTTTVFALSLTNATDSITRSAIVNVASAAAAPRNFQLEQNFPNPFNPASTIRYTIPEPSQVSLVVYNVLGEEVQTLFRGFHRQGSYSARFDGTTLPTGVYFAVLTAGSFQQVVPMLLLR